MFNCCVYVACIIHNHARIYTPNATTGRKRAVLESGHGRWDSKEVNIEGIKSLTRELFNDVYNFWEGFIDFLRPFCQRVIADHVNNYFILKAIRSFPLPRSLVSCVSNPREATPRLSCTKVKAALALYTLRPPPSTVLRSGLCGCARLATFHEHPLNR